jgi:nucleoside 2-deoxyribosyltransferase
MKRIYLSGPIEHVTEEYAKDWRRQVARQLESIYGMGAIDPTAYDGASAGLTPTEIVTRDTYLLSQADGAIFDVRSRAPMVGTAIELHIAWEMQIPTVAWGLTEADRKSAFLRYFATKIVETSAEAVDYLAALVTL